jgi:homoprotocatechuate degradation regulator HpaR
MTQASSPSRALPYRNLPELLLRAREAFLSHFRPIITAAGVTEQQWRIIRALSDAGPLEPREISTRCQILSPSLVGVLARMEELGLVERTRMPGDQRRLIVRLTPKAEQTVTALRPRVVEHYRALEELYGADLVADVFRVIDRVLARQEELSAKGKTAARKAKS